MKPKVHAPSLMERIRSDLGLSFWLDEITHHYETLSYAHCCYIYSGWIGFESSLRSGAQNKDRPNQLVPIHDPEILGYVLSSLG